MSSDSVYRTLQDLFPQVDDRLLRAVAIDHAKDPGGAVEFVLLECLSFVNQHPMASGSSSKHQNPEDSSLERVEGEGQCYLANQYVVEEASAGPSTKYGAGNHVHVDEASDGSGVDEASDGSGVDEASDGSGVDEASDGSGVDEASDGSGVDEASDGSDVDEALDDSAALEFYDANDDHDQARENTESEELVTLGKDQDISSNEGPDRISNVTATAPTPLHVDAVHGDPGKLCEETKMEELVSMQDILCNGVNLGQGHPCSDKSNALNDNGIFNGLNDLLVDIKYLDVNTFLSASSNAFIHEEGDIISNLKKQHAHSEDLKEFVDSDFVTEKGSGPDSIQPESGNTASCGILESVSLDHADKQDGSDIELIDVEAEPALNTIVSQSGQICNIDLLDEIIEDAKSTKKTLFSAMDSVMNMMREAEFQEQAVQHAREEAARGGMDILSRVEQLQEMLRHAEEANGMHAGEVYGEKAILATEARELQTRLLGLSDERNEALKILDEMQHSLEARIAAAEEEIEAAEQVKLEKEESARKALAEQEAIMERVVQESKILKQQSEENSKLQEFLIDRGHVVDMLQGEISVICQDVRYLKEKFDMRVPLSQSLSSSQTSCKLASSSSSLKSTASSSLHGQAEVCEAPKETSPAASVCCQSPKLARSPEESDDEKTLVADDEAAFVHDDDEKADVDDEEEVLVDDDGKAIVNEKVVLDEEEKALLDDGWDIMSENEMEM